MKAVLTAVTKLSDGQFRLSFHRGDSEYGAVIVLDGIPLTPAATAALLALARDPDAGVRAAVCHALSWGHELTSDTRGALLSLVRDPEAHVRAAAAVALSSSGDRAPAVADAFELLLDEDDRLLRLEGAYGLAKLDDPRTGVAKERVGPLGPGFEDDHRVSALWEWTRRNRPDQL